MRMTIRRDRRTFLFLTVFVILALETCISAEGSLPMGKTSLYISKECPPQILTGEQVTVTLTVFNAGEETIKNVVLKEKIAAGLEYMARTNGLTMKWALGEVAPKTTLTIRYSVKAISSEVKLGQTLLFVDENLVKEATSWIRVVSESSGEDKTSEQNY